MTFTFSPEERHPWLDALSAAPEAEVAALVGGYADVFPFNRAEPADAAASLIGRLSPDDPARASFDDGCFALLQSLRDELLLSKDGVSASVGALSRLLNVLSRVRPPKTINDINRRYVYWFGVFGTAVLDDGMDLRREYWNSLALTQNDIDSPNRRLMPLWLEICAEAGEYGRYAESYLDVGLLGLSYLPLGADHSSNEEAACLGLGYWALRQRPQRSTFLDRWREIESSYPRSAVYWTPLIAGVISAIENRLFEETGVLKASFPAASWWREDTDLPAGSLRQEARNRSRTVQLPAREEHQTLIADMGHNLDVLRPRIERLIERHSAYAESTSDVYFIVRTACNLGMALLRNEVANEHSPRGAEAVRLALKALEYAPSDVFAWSLWGYGLEAQGYLEAAENVRWEAILRFPEDPQRRNQLALQFATSNRHAEARLLLEDTLATFPHNSSTLNQLARLIAASDLPRAKRLLEDAIRFDPADFHAYVHLATLLVEDGNAPAAIEILDRFTETNKRDHERIVSLRSKILARDSIPAFRTQARLKGSTGTTEATELRGGRLRRALFMAEVANGAERQGALEEVKRLLAEDPGFAYGRYVAHRTGVASPLPSDSTFAFALQTALQHPADLQALVRRSSNIDRFVGKAILGLMNGANSIDVPLVSQITDEASSSYRFAALAGHISPSLTASSNRQPYIRLLADFSANDLVVIAA